MGFFIILRALLVRFLFSIHGLMCIWRLYVVTNDPRYWIICFALVCAIVEGVLTIKYNKGNEWKWFCPSVFIYLLGAVPAIWFLEMDELNERLRLRNSFATNSTIQVEIHIPIRLSSDQWVKALEQLLLLLLIIGRWLLPKGKLTHDQLSQLLLVYIGTAADIVEFFDAFKEDEARKDKSGLINKGLLLRDELCSCCTPDVYGIVISIMMQDIPFLILRMLLIFHYGVLSYTNMFFTCKNALVVALLMYRLVVVQLERRNLLTQIPIPVTASNSMTSRITDSTHSLTDLVRRSQAKVSEPEHAVKYTLKRHHKNEFKRSRSANEINSTKLRCFKEQYSLDDETCMQSTETKLVDVRRDKGGLTLQKSIDDLNDPLTYNIKLRHDVTGRYRDVTAGRQNNVVNGTSNDVTSLHNGIGGRLNNVRGTHDDVTKRNMTPTTLTDSQDRDCTNLLESIDIDELLDSIGKIPGPTSYV